MKYVGLVDWSIDGDSFRLEMLGEDQENHQFEVSAGCVSALLGALAAESARRNPVDGEQSFIRPTAMQVGKTGQNEPVILFSLKGGTELPLVFKPEALGRLISALEGLNASLNPSSQVRWS